MKTTGKKSAGSILLPTDFELASRRAFAYALKLGGVTGARLEILHVIKTGSESASIAPDRRQLNALKTAALLELGRLARLAQDAGVHAEVSLRFGVPDDCIVQAVDRVGAGLVVMGTEGRTGLDRLRIGSTAQAVVRKAPCSVLAVHGGLVGDSFRHPAQARLTRILIATDFSPYANAALDAVAWLSSRLHAAVCVLHVIEEGRLSDRRQRVLSHMTKELQERGIEAESGCLRGDPVEMVLDQATQWRADVIAVGTQGRRGLPRLLLGSVAEGILRRAGCPVLIVKRSPRFAFEQDQRGRRGTSS